jgi:hypothetical protein
MVAPHRRPLFAAWTLVAAILAAAATPHRHAVLSDERPGETDSQSVVTSHNPLANALHWHAVLKTVQEEACWACHWNRLFGAPAAAGVCLPLLPDRALSSLPARSAESVARFTRLSRGPPALL